MAVARKGGMAANRKKEPRARRSFLRLIPSDDIECRTCLEVVTIRSPGTRFLGEDWFLSHSENSCG